MLRSILAAGLTLMLAACASSQGASSDASSSTSSARDCFRALDVTGYGVVDESRIRVTISPQREYIITITQNTRDLDWTRAISIRSVTSFICTGNGAGVQVMGGDPPFPYQVTRIERAPQTAPAGS